MPAPRPKLRRPGGRIGDEARCVTSTGGPRVLLRRLRELMAEPLEPQERLDQIVRLIAANMVRRGLLALRAARRRRARALRHRGPEPERRPPGARCGSGEGLVGTDRRAGASRSTSPTRRRIRPSPTCRRPGEEIYQLLPRRAGAARRPHARRAGRAEPDHARTIATTRSRRC